MADVPAAAGGKEGPLLNCVDTPSEIDTLRHLLQDYLNPCLKPPRKGGFLSAAHLFRWSAARRPA